MEGLTNLLDSVAPSVSEPTVSHQTRQDHKASTNCLHVADPPFSHSNRTLNFQSIFRFRVFLLNGFKSAWRGVKLNAYPSPLGSHFIQLLEDNFQVIEDEARFCVA